MRNFQGIIFIQIWIYRKIFKSALVYFKSLRPEKQIELPSPIIFVWLIGSWTPFVLMTCFSSSHASVGDFWRLRGVWMSVLIWVGGTLLFLNGMLSCGVYPRLKVAFGKCWFKRLWENGKESLGRTENFVFCFWRALGSAWRIFR